MLQARQVSGESDNYIFEKGPHIFGSHISPDSEIQFITFMSELQSAIGMCN